MDNQSIYPYGTYRAMHILFRKISTCDNDLDKYVFIYIINNIACKYIYFIQSDILSLHYRRVCIFTIGYGLILTLSLWIKKIKQIEL